MIQPTRRFLLLLLAGLPLALLPALVAAELWVVWAGVLLLEFAALALDAWRASSSSRAELEVSAPGTVPIGSRADLRVQLSPRASSPRLDVELVADLDERFAEATAIRRRGNDALQLAIPLIPLRRGLASVTRLWLRFTGPWGLAARTRTFPLGRDVVISPDLNPVRQAALRYFRSQRMGGRTPIKLVGEGSEFDALREFQPGHNHRAMDWKASARHTKLLVRDFRVERNHQLILAFDTGHLMREPLDGMPKIDHAVQAALLLAYLSLQSGDRCGLFSFDSQVHSYFAPRSGVGAMPSLQKECATLDYSGAETNFTLGLTQLSQNLHRRSLVVLFSDFVDTVTATLMVENLGRLARRHLMLFVTFPDLESQSLAEAPPEDAVALNRCVVAQDLLRDRKTVLEQLRRLGVQVVEALPKDISSDLVNRYLDLKRREAL